MPHSDTGFVMFQVFAVRSNGAAGVVVKGPDEKFNISFRFDFFLDESWNISVV